MIETGTVVERLSAGRVRVEVRRGAACDGCHAKGACTPLSRGAVVRFEAEDPFACAPGDIVQVAIAEGAVLKAVWWVYGVPMILAIGCGIGAWGGLNQANIGATTRDLIAAGAFLGGAALGVGVLRGVEMRIRRSSAGSFRVRVIGPQGDVSALPPTGE